MTLQQLIYAVTVSEQTSMNKAASALFISQASLSASIQNLENELGITIFKRSNRGVTVTPEGAEFLLHARQIVLQRINTSINRTQRKASACRPSTTPLPSRPLSRWPSNFRRTSTPLAFMNVPQQKSYVMCTATNRSWAFFIWTILTETFSHAF